MSIEGLTTEEAKQKLSQNKDSLAALEEQNRKNKENILRLAIGAGSDDAGLLKLGFEQKMIDSVRNEIAIEKGEIEEKERIAKLREELQKNIAEEAEETKKINREQAEEIRSEIEWQLKQKEKAEEAKNAATALGKKLRQVGLREKDFESIPEWENLTEQQKMLVIEQASQQIFVDVKKEGEKRFSEKNKIKLSANPMNWRPSLVGKIWKKINKSAYVNSESKGALKDFKEGKLKPEQEVLQALTKRMAELNLNVVEKEGKPNIEFIQIDPNMSPEVKEAAERYNEIANEFSKMPDAWKNERAAKSLGGEKNYDQYFLLEHEYNDAKKKVIDLTVRKYKDEGIAENLAIEKAQTYMCEKDYKIAMMQFTNTSPDAILEMEKLQESSSWKKIFNGENKWRAAYMGLGYAGRAGLGMLGLVAAPITAGAIGAWRAKRKAEQKLDRAFDEGRSGKTFREMTSQERMDLRNSEGSLFEDKNSSKNMLGKIISGKEVNAREVAGFVDADSQIQRLENTLNKLTSVANLGEKARLISELERRSNYIQSKLEEGLINYGTNNPVGTNYEMLRLLSKAAVEIQANKFNFADIPDELIEIKVMSMDGSSRIEKRQLRDLIQQDNKDVKISLDELRQKNAIRFDEKEADFKQSEIIRGALVGASFSVLGRGIHYFQEKMGLGLHFGSSEHHNEKVAGAVSMTKVSNNEIVNNDSIPNPIAKDSLVNPTVSTNVPDSAQTNITGNLKDTIPTVPKAEIKVNVDENQIVKTEPTPKVDVTPKVEKVVTVPKAPVSREDLNKNIVLNDKNIVSTSSTTNNAELANDYTAKVEGLESDNINANENIDLSGARQITSTAPVIDETMTEPKVSGDNIDLSGATKISGPTVTEETIKADELPSVLKTEAPIIMDDNIRPTQQGGFSNESIGSGKIIKPSEPIEGYNTGEETGKIYPTRSGGALKGGPNAGNISREVPMTDREAVFSNKGNNVFENGVDNNVNEKLPIESDPRHFETAKEIKQTFGNKTVLIDKAEYPTLDQKENGVDYNDWNTANDAMFEQRGLEFNSYEDFSKERELQELFGTNTYTENPSKIVYDQTLGRNVEIPKHVSITQEYFRDMPEWKTVEKIPAKYFFQDDFLNGNRLPQADLDALVKKGIITQNPLTGTYSFSHRNEIERLSAMYKKLVSSKDYEKFIDKVEYKLGNDRPIGNENMETYIKRITSKIYKADDNTLYGFKRPVDWNDRDSWSRDYDGDVPSQDRMMRPISPTRRIYER